MQGILKLLSSLDGVLGVFELSKRDILNVIDIESQRSEELIPVFNQGIQECFKRDCSVVIFKKGFFRPPPSPTLLLIFDGEVLGHDIFTDSEKEKYRDDEDVKFLSDDFIIFKDVLHNHNLEKGNEYFVLPPVPFPELDGFDNISEVISSSPSTQSDEYLKEEYGYGQDSSVATIFVSFNFKD
ncbi:MAG: hypothetical protein IJQ68_03645 [Methanobrevibacter sp.]|uniref:hypothetical protein n=1 Tax=Methanobrevibacter sp. TaxID=66852 RepID=UPI0025E47449|nr:hypothetical protein [Methanobrevibacter sp.]MBR0271071.1 hypothetical protein [Methanobrevibacter sp.]